MTATPWKLSSAIIGGSAVITMGALGIGFGDSGVTGSGNFLIPAAPQATEQNATTTTAPAAPVTTLATPAVTASTPAGFGPAS